jgi:Fe2+ transport system protein FeoA
MSMPKTLDKLAAGTSATILDVAGEPDLQQRLLEMGLIPGSILKVVRFAPLGDPMEIKVMGYSLSLRRSEARFVHVEVAA